MTNTKTYTTYIFLRLGNWSAMHIWDNRFSTAEYEKMGFKIKIYNFKD